MCPDVHVTSNVELRNNVRLLLNVELRNYVISHQIVERRVTSDCYLNIELLVNIPITIILYNRHPSLPSPPLPSPPLSSPPLPSPPLPLSPTSPPHPLSPPSLRPLPTLSPPTSLPPLPSLQQINCPFQPKQSPSIFSSENKFTLKCNVKSNVGLLKFSFLFELHCANIYMLAAICIQSLTLNKIIIPLILVGSSSLLFLHLFPLLCGVDVSCETPTYRLVLRILP